MKIIEWFNSKSVKTRIVLIAIIVIVIVGVIQNYTG
jgi:hypothetical protein